MLWAWAWVVAPLPSWEKRPPLQEARLAWASSHTDGCTLALSCTVGASSRPTLSLKVSPAWS